MDRLPGLLLTGSRTKTVINIAEQLNSIGTVLVNHNKVPFVTALIIYSDCILGKQSYSDQKKMASVKFNILEIIKVQ